MQQKIIDILSISDLHAFYGYAKPKHPLVSIIDLGKIDRAGLRPDIFENAYRMSFYAVFCKKYKGNLKYGQTHYDFNEGSLMFLAPHQLIAHTTESDNESGWALFFHPDLLNTSGLGIKMGEYSFFRYDVNEALHVSEDEKTVLQDCLRNIEREYSQNLDTQSHNLIRSNIELLLNYCERFYGRQFLTRTRGSKDIVQRFERSLKSYFEKGIPSEKGIPDVKFFASELCLSPNYLSDLLKRNTGKTTQEHIHLQLIDTAKMMLLGSDSPVSEIAYALGFGHPSHFNKVFKAKAGVSPKEFRHSN